MKRYEAPNFLGIYKHKGRIYKDYEYRGHYIYYDIISKDYITFEERKGSFKCTTLKKATKLVNDIISRS